MGHPTKKPSRFNEELLPTSIVNSIEQWLVMDLLPNTPFKFNVQTLLFKFRTEFVQYVNRADEVDIPVMMRASKARAGLLSDFCQGVISLVLKGYRCYPVTSDYQSIKSNFKVRFAQKIIAVDPQGKEDDVELEINITNNPRMYKFLYFMVIEALMARDFRPEDVALVCVIAQSEGYIFESVKLTDQEILDVEQEFITAATTEDSWSEDSELSRLMDEVVKDMLLPNPPLYIADFKQVRRHHDGYMYNHPWTIDDAWYSTSSSGGSLEVDGKRIPNMGLLFSAVETDYTDPIDEIIGYRSLYPDEPFPGLVQYKSKSIHVPKTSSRGERWIHMNSNGRQDRGSYFENMCKHTLSNVVKCDTTFPQPGKTGVEFPKLQTELHDRVLICTDMKSATDNVSHQFLLKFWNIIFKNGCAESLLNLHSGDGVIVTHRLVDGHLEEQIAEYTQLSGIKCGTRSNFAVGLTYPHNFIIRCVMKAMGWDQVDPETLYRVHGDDNFFALPVETYKVFLDKYYQLCGEAGFHVHPLSSKGMISFPGDHLYRAEFNKQVYADGNLVSRIPHKTFFADATADKKLQVILWLSSYGYLEITGQTVSELLIGKNNPRWLLLSAAWNFLVEKKIFGIPGCLRITEVPELSDDLKFNLSLHVFIQCIETGVIDHILNNRSRLTRDQIRKKTRQETILFEDEELLRKLINWQNDHCPGIGKLEYTVSKNAKFADELKQLFDNPILWGHAYLGFFTLQEKETILKCLPYARFTCDPDHEMIDVFLSATEILTRTQPHSIGKRTKIRSNVIINTLEKFSEGLGTAGLI